MTENQRKIFLALVIKAMLNHETSFEAKWETFGLEDDANDTFSKTEIFLNELLSQGYDIDYIYPKIGSFPEGIAVYWN